MHWSAGVVLGTLGMLGFSGTLAATRGAVADFSPLTITCARIAVAGLLAGATLVALRRTQLPDKSLFWSLLWMGLGLAVAFPFFVALALESVPAVHGAVAVGLAPAATAIFSVIRTGERPPMPFWLACAAGFCAVFYFAFDAGGGHLGAADGWLLLGLLAVGFAYVEGGRVSGILGGVAALCWAMLLLLPFALIVLVWSIRDLSPGAVSLQGWVSLGYLGFISMFLASIFWYRGLAVGGIARIGQINLLQPLVALIWAALFLDEEITTTAGICAGIVLVAMIVCLKSRVR